MRKDRDESMVIRKLLPETVVDTDMFVEMPISAQCLYFHLLLRSDDDGFVVNPKQIMKQIGASKDDMQILVVKGYVHFFNSGILMSEGYQCKAMTMFN